MLTIDQKAQKRLSAFLETGAAKKGITLEDIASTLGVSYWTIASWKLARRKPRLSIIRRLEQEYKIKIL